MAITITTETETVIKKILPYLVRRGYEIDSDLDFETPVKNPERYSKGYVDILVTCGKSKPTFLIEAKRLAKSLTSKDRDQAVQYAKALNIPFVVVTNGNQVQCFNASNRKAIRWNGKLTERIPTKSQLPAVVRASKTNKSITDVPLENDAGLPFRPGLPLKQLNALFARCHNAIRKIEKDEENTFADFSKLLFLKLLEEKDDAGTIRLPYSYRFHELAEHPKGEADQVQAAVGSMVDRIKRLGSYGEVLEEPLYLKKPATFLYIVQQLAGVNFTDSSLDSKGAAFEYYVRATLKGKKLGQYFTPRALVEVVSAIVGREKILNAVRSGTEIRVLDPACGTGGFLVFLMQQNIAFLNDLFKERKITKANCENLADTLKQKVFYGADANSGVACAAKMNMIIAGDGHSNIQCEDSLKDSVSWDIANPNCDLIITNPPFGTSESESLSAQELAPFPIRSLKGQHLFLQKMILCTKAGGEICTVIDEGVLNTESASDLRKWILTTCLVKAVIRLPEETFRPNKITVRSSLLLLERRAVDDIDLEDDYKITFADIRSLGYEGSGDTIRGFDFKRLIDEIASEWFTTSDMRPREGFNWRVYLEYAQSIVSDGAFRLDFKYWEPGIKGRIKALSEGNSSTIASLNVLETERGTSPPAETYVDEQDGYALVVKAGSNISKHGELIPSGDFIEKNLYDEYVEKATNNKRNGSIVRKDDVLLASTGDGTLGKCCVYTSNLPAIADGHVTIIRVDPNVVWPNYLCDYLRCGFGATQVERLYTGSTGLTELTPKDVGRIVVDLLSGIPEQRKTSKALRHNEQEYTSKVREAEANLSKARAQFRGVH